MIKDKVIPIAPQLSDKPPQLNLPDFARFEVITQGDAGELLTVLRTAPASPARDKIIELIESGPATLAIRACDITDKRCSKKPFSFPAPLNGFYLDQSDYLEMGKAWQEMLRYSRQWEAKGVEDQRRIDELIKRLSPPE